MESSKAIFTVEARGSTSKSEPQIMGIYSTKNHAYVAMRELAKRRNLEFRMILWKCVDFGLLPGRAFQEVSTVLKDWGTPL